YVVSGSVWHDAQNASLFSNCAPTNALTGMNNKINPLTSKRRLAHFRDMYNRLPNIFFLLLPCKMTIVHCDTAVSPIQPQ
ncbi:MAG: hypothetical protein KC421_27095, partial [Anaerolineales bacterium]|nr:hypothetical protein [Anaerolineales bacterium]